MSDQDDSQHDSKLCAILYIYHKKSQELQVEVNLDFMQFYSKNQIIYTQMTNQQLGIEFLQQDYFENPHAFEFVKREEPRPWPRDLPHPRHQ